LTTLQLGLGITSSAGPDANPVGEARLAESLGFDFVSASDHLNGASPTFEPWTLLTTVAAATERLNVLTRVLAVPYRHPAVTAKMAETLDRLSGGRLVLGLGSGGYAKEFSAFGLDVRTAGQQVSALGEAVELIRELWSKPDVTFEGEHFQLRRARIEPRPARRIPIWLGTYGPRALRLTGALADGWLPSLPGLELEQAIAMRTTVRAAAEAAGRDPDEITCAANIAVTFDSRRSPTPRAVAGSSDAIAGQVVEIVRAGFTFLNVMSSQLDARERFATDVMPLVRQEMTGAR
jgi:probable F420-dependent oxidoreductase